ncbi:PREDICTED: receptor-type tyrosine-protein phosphatase alpha-like [Priapulus caudatus]|uniref:Receptor-type tyrosine-protein phosphatase alpha-like n=1 Tax=Priapulus caudatus TaxID=37621 RepID=A0ABM1DY94_PRICU|nr:PREDICTED: receptor-type tyrosine-protein phosphatase alpha-like [Priapulus caudatus]
MIVRKLKLLKDDSPDEEPLRVTQVQLLDEPLSNQQSAVSMATLLARVHMWMKKAEFMKGPVTVHCMNGASSAGIYCVCSYVFDQIAAEETVDILKAVKVARSSRPQFIENFDQYRFCYDVIKEYLESYSVV